MLLQDPFERSLLINTFQNYAQSIVLEEQALKMPRDIQNGSLSEENDQFQIL